MRDPTRGGLATTLNEISLACGYNIAIEEAGIPIKKPVRALCEILGFDPLYMANEGKLIAIVSKDAANNILSRMKRYPLGKDARIIGEVKKEKYNVKFKLFSILHIIHCMEEYINYSRFICGKLFGPHKRNFGTILLRYFRYFSVFRRNDYPIYEMGTYRLFNGIGNQRLSHEI